jgi:hypothetical protein
VLKRERAVELFDVDAAVLPGLDAAGDLDWFLSGGLGSARARISIS